MEADFYEYYQTNQKGGSLPDIPVFVGAKRYGQYGAGIGDVFRSIWRFISPIAKRGASSFLTNLASATTNIGKSGEIAASLGNILKSAAVPAAGEMLQGAVDDVKQRIQDKLNPQQGSGRRKRPAVYKPKKKSTKCHRDIVYYNFG